MKKVIVSILIVILVAIAGIGGWSLWNLLQKENRELENKIAQLENRVEEYSNNEESSFIDETKNENVEFDSEIDVVDNNENYYITDGDGDFNPFISGINIVESEEINNRFPGGFHNYYFDVNTNENDKKAIHEQVNHVLARYPKGFWDEILTNSSKKALVIGLVNEISGRGNIYNSPTGFATYDDENYYLFINSKASSTGANYELSMFHELMHIIDFYFQEMNIEYKDYYNYLPNGFVYTEYGKEHTSEEFDMCYLHQKDPNKVWFDGIYSTETIFEDRASMMASIYLNGIDFFKEYPHLYARMDYMRKVITDNIKAVKNSDGSMFTMESK